MSAKYELEAKERNLGSKKERESASAQGFRREHESAGAKTKKARAQLCYVQIIYSSLVTGYSHLGLRHLGEEHGKGGGGKAVRFFGAKAARRRPEQ
jgi:hypothetical protein